MVVGVVFGTGTAFLIWAITGWTLADAGAYWQAALRLRDGEPLYPLLTNVDASEVYRYAP